MESLWSWSAFLVIGVAGFLAARRFLNLREATQLVRAMGEDKKGERGNPSAKRPGDSPIDLAAAGIRTPDAQSRYHSKRRWTLLASTVLGALLWILFGRLEPLRAILFICGGYFIGYFIAARGYQRARQRYVRELEFHLPLVMERLVMAVHAGLDVLAAIRAILQHEQAAGRPLSPVSERLQQVLRYTESGLGFDEALRLISDQTPCPALRHAFLHLGTAYREGGELVMPLRELSDATQLYYQETLEEEVAAMPVKATVPLVITFAGLIMIFVAMPLVQVMSMMKRSMPEQTHEIR